MIQFTRKDYMTGKVSHDEYYAQFVTEMTKEIVRSSIGMEAILASKDPHFNDIPLKNWDSLHPVILRTSGRDCTDVHWDTLGTSVCIAKCAARMIKAEESSEVPTQD